MPRRAGNREPSFWQLFGVLKADFEPLYWYFDLMPWMGPPLEFYDDELVLVDFPGARSTESQLWSPGALARYGDAIGEEFLSFWGIDTRDDPVGVAGRASVGTVHQARETRLQYAKFWIRYTDGACWEIYAREPARLAPLRASHARAKWVEVFDADTELRGEAFRRAGLDAIWNAMRGGTS